MGQDRPGPPAPASRCEVTGDHRGDTTSDGPRDRIVFEDLPHLSETAAAVGGHNPGRCKGRIRVLRRREMDNQFVVEPRHVEDVEVLRLVLRNDDPPREVEPRDPTRRRTPMPRHRRPPPQSSQRRRAHFSRSPRSLEVSWPMTQRSYRRRLSDGSPAHDPSAPANAVRERPRMRRSRPRGGPASAGDPTSREHLATAAVTLRVHPRG